MRIGWVWGVFVFAACTTAPAPDPVVERTEVEAKELPVPDPAPVQAEGPVVPAGPGSIQPGQGIVRTAAGYPQPKLAPRKISAIEVEARDPPGPGTLRIAKDDKVLAIPLQHTDVQTVVTGTIAETTVTQMFVNPYDEVIEATYVFPLPHDAAVDDYWFHVGKRHIHGVMKEKEEAKKIYEEAKAAGKSAALLVQQKPNIFTQSVANIPPGETMLVEMHMAHPLAQVDGRYTYAFPTVVGPRFLASPEDEGVNPSLLPEGTRSGHDISISVDIDAGLPVADLSSKTHKVGVEPRDKGASIRLATDDTIPNKDFELTWSLAQDDTKAWLMVQRQEGGGFFTLTVQPPKVFATQTARGRELVFVVDNSGSMRGKPLDTAKAAMTKVLAAMRPSDSFSVLRFSEQASALGPALLPATEANRTKALEYTAAMEGMGGTAMIEGVKAALSFPHDDATMRLVLFMTDGYVSNDFEIFGTLQSLIGSTRLFSMGVGNSVNRHLLEGMATVGRGAVTYATLDADPAPAVASFFDRIANPVLTDIEIDWGELPVRDVVPAAIPDLFTGQPVVVFGKFDGEPNGQAKVTGKLGATPVEIAVDLNVAEAKGGTVGLASLWARKRIDDLKLPTYAMKSDDPRRDGVKKQIIDVALEYSVMSEYTSFVAVDQQRVVNPDGTYKTVDVPVEVPDGVDPSAVRPRPAAPIRRKGGGGSSSGYGAGGGAGFGGRGKKVPRVRQGGATVSGALDKDIVRRIVRSHINEVRHCYNGGLAKNPSLQGTIVVAFTVSAAGKVTAASVKDDKLGDKTVAQCVVKAVKRWKFPKPQGGGEAKVTYPFVLAPG